MLLIFAIFLAPLMARAAFYAAGDGARSWRDADWSSTGLLPQAADYKPARLIVFTGTTGAWKGIFSVHSWIVFKRAGDADWTRYDVVGWGRPVRANGWPADGRWYGNMPVAIADVSGDEAARLIPKVELAVRSYSYNQYGDYRIWPGPNSNSFTAAVLARGAGTRRGAAGQRRRPRFPRRLLRRPDRLGTGVELNAYGLAAFKVGWVEGVEVNLLGLVAGLDLRHPGGETAGLRPDRRRIAGCDRLGALKRPASHAELSGSDPRRGDEPWRRMASSRPLSNARPGQPRHARHPAAARQDSVSGPAPAASSTPCRSMSAIAATRPAFIATSMPGRTAPRKWPPTSPNWCSTLSSAARSRTLDITGGAPELNANFRRMVTGARALGAKVMDRCNLTILEQPGQEDLAQFLAANEVEVVASMPCYLEDNVEAQRGKGVFDQSIRGLQALNALGYGRDPEADLESRLQSARAGAAAGASLA